MNNSSATHSTKICNSLNENAWNELSYEAWKKKYGMPEEMAKKLIKCPEKYLSLLYDKFGDVNGKKIGNIMGSNGIKSVALALLGAKVNIFDFSVGNKHYAEELAHNVNVDIRYVLENVIELSDEELTEDYDIVFAEMGILHYFTDMTPLFDNVYKMLKSGGIFVLRDFHPVSNKLISARGTTAKIRKYKVDGDYFDTSLKESDISFSKYLPNFQTKKVYLRKWNLGEIITSIAKSGLTIKSLDEEPNLSCEQYDKGIPKTFTIVALK